MKRFLSAIVIAMLVIVGTFSNIMAATPRLLCPGLGDPSAIIIGSTVYLTGTDGTNTVNIKTLPLANLYSTIPASYLTSFYTYNPSSFGVGTFTNVMSQTLFNEPGGNVGLVFTGDINGGYTSVYYSENLGAPVAINSGSTTYPHTSNTAWNGTQAQERLKLRIGDDVFYDDVDNDGIDNTDPMWNCYTYFYNGNNVALWQQGGTGAQTTPVDIQIGSTIDTVDHIAEGGELFKRGSYYYCIYSIGHWLGGYNMYYKKATSVAGLALQTTAQCIAHTVPTAGVWNNLVGDYGYTKNSGAPCVLQDGTTYNLIFHVGVPISGTYMYANTPNTSRATYVVALEFYTNGNIKMITLP